MNKLIGLFKFIPPIGRIWARDQVEGYGYDFSAEGFLQCVRDNRLDVAALFLKAGIDVNGTGERDNTAFMEACRWGHTEIISLLLKEPNIEIDKLNEDKDTALTLANRENRMSVLEILLKYENLKVNVHNITGDSALLEACRKGRVPNALLLLSHPKIEVIDQGIDADTPLILAVRSGKLELVRAILQHLSADQKADGINQRNKAEIDALYEAKLRGYREIEKELVDNGADQTWSARKYLAFLKIDFDKDTFLRAIKSYDETTVDLFLDAGIDLSARAERNNTPLILAAERGWTHLVQRLLKLGVDKNDRNIFQITAVMMATYFGFQQIVDLLRNDRPVENRLDETGLLEIELIMAIEAGDIDAVRDVLQHKPNLNQRTPQGESLLILATSVKDPQAAVAITRELLAARAKTETTDIDGKTALMHAAEHNQCELIDMLIAYGAKANHVIETNKKTALILAAERGNTGAVKCLLAKGVDADQKDTSGKTARIAALLGQHLDTAKALPIAPADDEWVALYRAAYIGNLDRFKQAMAVLRNFNIIVDDFEDTPLMIASKRGSLEIVEFLVSDADLNVRNQAGDTALILAAGAGHVEVVKTLLARGASVEIKNKAENTALIEAAIHGNADVIQVLLDHGADPWVTGKNKTTALVEVCSQGSLSAVQALLDFVKLKGPQKLTEFANQEVPRGFTAWMTAALSGYPLICETLAACQGDHGKNEARLFEAASRGDMEELQRLEGVSVNYNARNRRGFTPLMEAVQNGHLAAVEFLLGKGSDPKLSGGSGTSALNLAAEAGREDLLELLLPLVKDKETQMIDALVTTARHGYLHTAEYLLRETQEYINGNKTRGVPLVVAAAHGHVDLVRLLLQHGANVDEQDAQGQTALSSVILSENDTIIRVLLEHGASLEMVKDANLIVEARAGHLEQVESLLGSHARVNACDREGRTALIWACTNQHTDVVRSLVKGHHADIAWSTKSGRTALMEACKKGNREIVQILLESLDEQDKRAWSAVVDADDEANYTPLKEALLRGYKEIVKVLENYGAQRGREDAELLEAADKGRSEALKRLVAKTLMVDVRDRSNRTPLMLAAHNGWKEGVEILLNSGAVLDLTDKRGETALLLAVKNRHVSVVDFLLDSKANHSIASSTGDTALMRAASLGMDTLVQRLIALQAAVNVKNASGETALILAARHGQQGAVTHLLEAGADPDVTAHNGRTALMEAADGGHVEIVKSLLKKRAKYQIADENGATALMSAVLKKQSSVVSLLAGLGGDFLDEVDREGRTAMTLAHLSGMLTHHTESQLARSANKLPQAVKLLANDIEENLLRCGARTGWDEAELILAAKAREAELLEQLMLENVNINVRDLNGCTAVWHAAANGDIKSVQCLVTHEADVNLPDHERRRPLLEAARGGHLEIVQSLVKAGAKVDAPDEERNTALIEAARNGHREVVEFLIHNGANPAWWNNNVHTALMEASAHGHLGVVKALLLIPDGLKDTWGPDRYKKYLSFMDSRRRTARDLARNREHQDCDALLKEHGVPLGKEIDLIVYTSLQGRCYHQVKCPAIKEARQEDQLTALSITEARAKGFDSCNRCKPEQSGEIEKLTVLFLTAEPTDQQRLQLGKEAREIQEALQMAKLRDFITLEQRHALQPKGLSQALLDVEPDIVHFSGHGFSDGSIGFESPTDTTQAVTPDALVDLFEQFKNVKCVLLNACYTEILADKLVEHIPYVIGSSDDVDDKAAIAFSIGFYQALGAGRLYEDAYKLGCALMETQMPDELKPVLRQK